MGIFTWILFGLIAGAIAKWLTPGKDPGGIIVTILLGIGGAVVGGYFGMRLGWGGVNDFNLRSFGLAVGGALLILLVFRLLFTQNHPK